VKILLKPEHKDLLRSFRINRITTEREPNEESRLLTDMRKTASLRKIIQTGFEEPMNKIILEELFSEQELKKLKEMRENKDSKIKQFHEIIGDSKELMKQLTKNLKSRSEGQDPFGRMQEETPGKALSGNLDWETSTFETAQPSARPFERKKIHIQGNRMLENMKFLEKNF